MNAGVMIKPIGVAIKLKKSGSGIALPTANSVSMENAVAHVSLIEKRRKVSLSEVEVNTLDQRLRPALQLPCGPRSDSLPSTSHSLTERTLR